MSSAYWATIEFVVELENNILKLRSFYILLFFVFRAHQIQNHTISQYEQTFFAIIIRNKNNNQHENFLALSIFYIRIYVATRPFIYMRKFGRFSHSPIIILSEVNYFKSYSINRPFIYVFSQQNRRNTNDIYRDCACYRCITNFETWPEIVILQIHTQTEFTTFIDKSYFVSIDYKTLRIQHEHLCNYLYLICLRRFR